VTLGHADRRAPGTTRACRAR